MMGLFYRAIEDCFALGDRRLDFGEGEQHYKLRLADCRTRSPGRRSCRGGRLPVDAAWRRRLAACAAAPAWRCGACPRTSRPACAALRAGRARPAGQRRRRRSRSLIPWGRRRRRRTSQPVELPRQQLRLVSAPAGPAAGQDHRRRRAARRRRRGGACRRSRRRRGRGGGRPGRRRARSRGRWSRSRGAAATSGGRSRRSNSASSPSAATNTCTLAGSPSRSSFQIAHPPGGDHLAAASRSIAARPRRRAPGSPQGGVRPAVGGDPRRRPRWRRRLGRLLDEADRRRPRARCAAGPGRAGRGSCGCCSRSHSS